jgi:hypothetical protein
VDILRARVDAVNMPDPYITPHKKMGPVVPDPFFYLQIAICLAEEI